MTTYTAFAGSRRIAHGGAREVTDTLSAWPDDGATLLVFDDETGRQTDLDPAAPPDDTPVRLRGRPRLGVVAREVTLLPRHWDWLAAQPGGASAALRRLVEAARKQAGGDRRARQEAAYRFVTAIAGDLPGYEEAMRALFADDRAGFAARIAGWPADLRDHALRLAYPDQ